MLSVSQRVPWCHGVLPYAWSVIQVGQVHEEQVLLVPTRVRLKGGVAWGLTYSLWQMLKPISSCAQRTRAACQGSQFGSFLQLALIVCSCYEDQDPYLKPYHVPRPCCRDLHQQNRQPTLNPIQDSCPLQVPPGI